MSLIYSLDNSRKSHDFLELLVYGRISFQRVFDTLTNETLYLFDDDSYIVTYEHEIILYGVNHIYISTGELL